MNSFIEEFYYGNIDPQARSSEQNKKVQHDMQTLNESEDFLTDKLSGEEKKRFLQYVDAGHPLMANPPSRASSPAFASALSSHSTLLLHRKHRTRTTWKTRYKPRSGSANYGGAGFFCSISKIQKKFVIISQVFADNGNALSNRALFFLSKVWNSYHILDFSVNMWYPKIERIYVLFLWQQNDS